MTPAAFEATYSDFKLVRSRKCVQIVLEIPLERANEVLNALGGMPNPASETWCAVARLDLAKVKEAAEPTKRTPIAPEKRLAQRAGILCSDPVFQKYMTEAASLISPLDEDGAAEHLRAICGVESRSEIIPNTPEGDRFERLYGQFIAWRDHDMPAERVTA